MKEVDIGKLDSPKDTKNYPNGTVFVLNDDKIILPPETIKEKKEAAGQ